MSLFNAPVNLFDLPGGEARVDLNKKGGELSIEDNISTLEMLSFKYFVQRLAFFLT